ncbi:MAG TPA: TetR/AcrR family transcriptional regulator [Methylophilaceae bacterium]|nr:TetR/AcrR family transcriptional regulator [Methylophilaceae bacterium]
MQLIKVQAEPADASSTERILAAAEALFSEQGFDAVSMNAIAARAGVSKANIFHHFSNKNALYLAVVKDACKESQVRLQHMESSTSSLAERLTHFARSQLQSMLDHGQTTRLILRELLQNGPEHGRELAEQVFGQSFARLVEMIRDGQTRSELRREIDPAAVAVMLIAINVYFFEARDVLRHYPDVDFADDPQRYSEKLLQLMLHGILPAPKEPQQ